jgi:hypothetical protein
MYIELTGISKFETTAPFHFAMLSLLYAGAYFFNGVIGLNLSMIVMVAILCTCSLLSLKSALLRVSHLKESVQIRNCGLLFAADAKGVFYVCPAFCLLDTKMVKTIMRFLNHRLCI